MTGTRPSAMSGGLQRLVEDEVVLACPREAIWRILDDPAALQRVVPGCESLVAERPGRYAARLSTRLGFVTLRLAGSVELRDVERPSAFRLEIDGRPIGLAGSLTVSVPVSLVEPAPRRTAATYAVDLRLTGRLAAFGAPILRAAVRTQVGELVANLERELAAES